ncbi:phage portal protein [Devosia elaeis]|uniref:Portal protein n=1 Tax=Devosia elaeis TaxID=1770058 RepID=A0A178I0I3_9HYPH|nr:phage portal protein [Devosia elaeis]OAM77708.1 portal protein [Devosia elaeis]
MGFFDRWVGRPIKLTDGAFWRGFFGLGTDSGEVVTYDKAMALDAVWACVNLIANSVKTLPCVVYDKDGVTRATDDDLYDLLHDAPNIDDTAADFWGMVALCLCLDGNFFAEKKMNGGKLVALNPIHPLKVDVQRNSRNERVYEVTEDGKKRKISEDRMFHVRGAVLPGCDRGLSPIGYVANTIGNARAAEKAAGKWFSGGMSASGFLKSDQVLKPEQRKQIGDMLQQYAGSDRAGKVMVLEAGLEYHQLTVNPKDAQMIETRQFSVEQICRIFGVPPVMIGHAANGTTTWGSGIEQLILQFIKTCLAPMLRSIEASIRRDLMDASTRKRLTVKFSLEGLLRGDSAARAEFLSKMVSNGIYTENEARAYEDKEPKPGGDHLLVNGTMQRADQIGVQPPQPPANQNNPAPPAAA